MDDEIKKLVDAKPMSPPMLRKMWARTAIMKHLLIAKGWITQTQWEEMENDLIHRIEDDIRKKIEKDLGLDEDPDDGTPGTP